MFKHRKLASAKTQTSLILSRSAQHWERHPLLHARMYAAHSGQVGKAPAAVGLTLAEMAGCAMPGKVKECQEQVRPSYYVSGLFQPPISWV